MKDWQFYCIMSYLYLITAYLSKSLILLPLVFATLLYAFVCARREDKKRQKRRSKDNVVFYPIGGTTTSSNITSAIKTTGKREL